MTSASTQDVGELRARYRVLDAREEEIKRQLLLLPEDSLTARWHHSQLGIIREEKATIGRAVLTSGNPEFLPNSKVAPTIPTNGTQEPI